MKVLFLDIDGVVNDFTTKVLPEKMALLLTKMDDSPEAARAARRVHAWLVQSALLRDPEQDKP